MSYFNILFLDIETVGTVADYADLDERWQGLWQKKAAYFLKADESKTAANLFREKAAIYAEFGKVVCISFGFLHGHENDLNLKVKSIAGHDERLVLYEFASFLQNHYSDLPREKLCGHNIREFDIPYLCRRMIKHGVNLPDALNLSGKRPWEVKHLIDTLELWKFGDFKNYTSLDVLAAVFDIETPKDDIDGSMVHPTYYDEQNLDRIVTYCEKDVLTTARVYMKMMHQMDILKENVEFVPREA